MKIDAYKFTEKLFGSTQAIKDYLKAGKLYDEYKRIAQNPKVKHDVILKKRDELKDITKEAYIGITRLYTIYTKAYEETKKASANMIYSTTEQMTFYDKLKEINADITLKYNELFKEEIEAKQKKEENSNAEDNAKPQ